MSVPEIRSNGEFQSGTLCGFETEGIVEIKHLVRSFDNLEFIPGRGLNFAALDNVPVNIDGERISGTATPTDFIKFQDIDGNETTGADGAIISSKGVVLNPGEVLYYQWAFLKFDASPWNDFACFYAYSGDGSLRDAFDHHRLVNVGNPRPILSDVLTLEGKRKSHTGWQEGIFRPETPFNGTVCWVVSNGQSLSDPRSHDPEIGAFARPSTLLLDWVEIRNE